MKVHKKFEIITPIFNKIIRLGNKEVSRRAAIHEPNSYHLKWTLQDFAVCIRFGSEKDVLIKIVTIYRILKHGNCRDCFDKIFGSGTETVLRHFFREQFNLGFQPDTEPGYDPMRI